MEGGVDMNIVPIKVLETNYCYCIHDGDQAWVVDPGESEPVIDYLIRNKLVLEGILLTHKHWDHTQGVEALRERYGVRVYGGAREDFPFVCEGVEEGECIRVFGQSVRCLHTPGHTIGGCVWYFSGVLFSGDILFGGGCGRIFEGSAFEMYQSLKRLSMLPLDTKVYFGHEYTKRNLVFAMQVLPRDADIQDRLKATLGVSTPSTIELERKTNVFFRVNEKEVQAAVRNNQEVRLSGDVGYFQALRVWKNQFDEGDE